MNGLTRRGALSLAGTLLFWRRAAAALSSAPLEVSGEWPQSSPDAPARVIERMRAVCLAGIRLVSDRQPARLRVDEHADGPPYVFLHKERPDTGWIAVDVGARDWCKLAYQFGHELGHVLCNSWQWGATPAPPCQWLEESLVEAFSIHGLALLAESWARDPPFPGNAEFAQAIRQYRAQIIDGYGQTVSDLAAWFHANRAALEAAGGVAPVEGPLILTLAAEYARDRDLIADLGALNRWPGRSTVPLEDYLRLWRASCVELRAPNRLPALLARRLGLG